MIASVQPKLTISQAHAYIAIVRTLRIVECEEGRYAHRPYEYDTGDMFARFAHNDDLGPNMRDLTIMFMRDSAVSMPDLEAFFVRCVGLTRLTVLGALPHLDVFVRKAPQTLTSASFTLRGIRLGSGSPSGVYHDVAPTRCFWVQVLPPLTMSHAHLTMLTIDVVIERDCTCVTDTWGEPEDRTMHPDLAELPFVKFLSLRIALPCTWIIPYFLCRQLEHFYLEIVDCREFAGGSFSGYNDQTSALYLHRFLVTHSSLSQLSLDIATSVLTEYLENQRHLPLNIHTLKLGIPPTKPDFLRIARTVAKVVVNIDDKRYRTWGDILQALYSEELHGELRVLQFVSRHQNVEWQPSVDPTDRIDNLQIELQTWFMHMQSQGSPPVISILDSCNNAMTSPEDAAHSEVHSEETDNEDLGDGDDTDMSSEEKTTDEEDLGDIDDTDIGDEED
jgi:hypothetical protein